MHLTNFKMKNITTLILTALILFSCGSKSQDSVEQVIESGDISAIREKKSELINQQNDLREQVKKLDIALEQLNTGNKVPLITTLQVNPEPFYHFLELQGNVTTKNLLVLYPEFSGILTEVFVKEGQQVRKGQLLAKIDDGGLSQQLSQMKIQFELAKTTYDRQTRLWEQKIGSEMQYLQAKSNYEAQEQAIAQLEQQVAKTEVIAPFSGTIDDVMTERGSVVLPGQTALMRIINLDNMYIEVDVPERYVNSVTRDKKVEVDFSVLNKSMESKIRQVGDFINPSNRTFKAEIGIPNKDRNIKPNLTAKLRINDYSNEQALLIPQSIISENAGGEQFLYVVRERTEKGEARAEKLTIETGLSQGDVIEVTSGLEAGMEVIVEGARSVNEGQKVKIIN